MKTSVPYAQVAEFAEQVLGVADASEIASIEIGDGGPVITVTEYRTDEDGRRYAVGDDVATVTTQISIDNERKE